MLPVPSTAYRSRQRPPSQKSFLVPGHLSRSAQGVSDRFRARTRLTNLAVTIITSSLCLSLLVNFKLWSSGRVRSGDGEISLFSSAPGSKIASIEQTIDRTDDLTRLTHLVLVAGHAIWKGGQADRRDDDDNWVLTPIQKGGSVKTFYKHIEAGVQEALNDPDSLLIFSGGQTRPDTPPTTESQSYMNLALASNLLPPSSEFKRATTEEYALDSYTNILFSYARFKEYTGRWPEKITVIGYEMKRPRFEKLHRLALRIPERNFSYIGIDDEGDTTESYEGELNYGYQPFSEDLYGCFPPLSIKRTARNPFARYHPYHTSCPELSGILEWCPVHKAHNQVTQSGHERIYPYVLPWNSDPMDKAWSREQD